MRTPAEAASPSTAGPRLRTFAGRAGSVGLLALLSLWAVFLRPTTFGGPAMYVIATGGSMEPGIHAGDLVIGFTQPTYQVGDAVVFRLAADSGYEGRLVVHRIVAGDAETGFTLQGDASANRDPWTVAPGDIIGRVSTVVAAGGRILIFLRNPLLLASVAAGLVFVFIILPGPPRRPRGTQPQPMSSGSAT